MARRAAHPTSRQPAAPSQNRGDPHRSPGQDKGPSSEPRTLFVEHGYVATTIRDVARAAGVGERTVYGIFPSKADLFRHVLDVATVGNEEPVGVASRPEIQSAFRQSDPRDAINQNINYMVALFERAGDLIMVTVQAADADPDMRAAADAGSRATRQLWLN